MNPKRITRAAFERMLAERYPYLAAHAEPDLVNGKGYCFRSRGPADSFVGFSTWLAAAVALELIGEAA